MEPSVAHLNEYKCDLIGVSPGSGTSSVSTTSGSLPHMKELCSEGPHARGPGKSKANRTLLLSARGVTVTDQSGQDSFVAATEPSLPTLCEVNTVDVAKAITQDALPLLDLPRRHGELGVATPRREKVLGRFSALRHLGGAVVDVGTAALKEAVDAADGAESLPFVSIPPTTPPAPLRPRSDSARVQRVIAEMRAASASGVEARVGRGYPSSAQSPHPPLAAGAARPAMP